MVRGKIFERLLRSSLAEILAHLVILESWRDRATRSVILANLKSISRNLGDISQP